MFFSQILEPMAEYRSLCDSIASKNAPVHVYGVTQSQKNHLIYSLCQQSGSKCLIVVSDEAEARRIKEDLSFFFCDEVLYFPQKEYVFYNVDAINRDSEYKRIATLSKMKNARAVVTTVKALMQYTIPKQTLKNCIEDFAVGTVIDLQMLCSKLVYMGYKRVHTVESYGQFSLRGSILDIFSPTSTHPIRIELFDDEIDSIRQFDAISQISLKNVSHARICPVRELLYSVEEKEKLIKKIASLKNENLHGDIERIDDEYYIPSGDKYMPLVYEKLSTLLDFIDEKHLVFFDESANLSEAAQSFYSEKYEIISSLAKKGLFPKIKGEYLLSYGDIVGRLDVTRLVSLSTLSYTTPQIRPKEIVSIVGKSMQNYSGNTEFFAEDVKYWKDRDYRVIILSDSKSVLNNIYNLLFEENIEAVYWKSMDDIPPYSTVSLVEGSISKGFEYASLKTVVICETDIFSHKKKKRKEKSTASSREKIKSYNDLNKGDLVVHKIHGIGQYEGITQMTSNNVVKDFLKIKYKGTDVLYVPASQLDSIHKYIGGSEDAKVSLNSLNGTKWNKSVSKVKESVEKMAQRLIELYAERQNIKGHVFEEDTPWQKDFEDDFGYDETDDQLKCISEVKADMEEGKCMDRLLCGDVGYGKTEVAMRAAFKCVMGGLQVAYLVPTTLLAQQHYNTFSARMKDYGVNVELLCRFKKKKEQENTIERLKAGKCDIVIGTHRLLSKDVDFKNLGLLIIDEEQRFGVAHKEKLKEIKKNVNVLTLSATPIPRTLNMAMVGIRDLSVIATPPGDRYPVQTFVMERDERAIKNAIDREMARGGQVFYINNRIDSIERKANMIRELVPNATVEIAHGQMGERELEAQMLSMINGDTDVLVCTTIIETGIDIPNANTMIIDNADHLGLSQLYQLRGRVGRSNRLSYAYLMYDGKKVLDQVAQKRLSAIKEFTEFGSGFKIAMRDLEIRGAGNLLGKEQHGNMNLVGYDMYCSLLGEAVAELKGEKPDIKIDTNVDLKTDAYIPQSYIEQEEEKLIAYKKIADICSMEDYLNIQSELTDRYGDMPKPAENLLDCAYIKAMAGKLKITSVVRNGNEIMFTINDSFSERAIVELIGEYKGKIMYTSGEKSYLCYKCDNKYIANIKIILQKLIKLTQEDNKQL